MTVYNDKKNRGDIFDYIDTLIKTEYIPIEEKDRRAEIIVNNTYYSTSNDGKKVLHINSTAKHMYTFLTLVDMYTDIEINYADGVKQYNELDESGALDIIVGTIEPNDLKEFKIILDMKCNDVMVNEYDPHAFIRSQVDRFADLFGALVAPALENLDLDKIQELIQSVSSKEV